MRFCLAFIIGLFMIQSAFAQKTTEKRDEFFWLSQINKASVLTNKEAGLLDNKQAESFAKAIKIVIENANAKGAVRPDRVISYEPLLIEVAGQDITILHAGRSSQDMHATFGAAIMRDNVLLLAQELNKVNANILKLAEANINTIVPNYTNGVMAQPNSFAHFLLGYYAGFERDSQRIREAYERMDKSPMGTTVLNGTSWPLNRKKMADYLGFSDIVDNAYDAAQIAAVDRPVEVGGIVQGISVHISMLIEDIMQQYAQTRPWMLLQESAATTYVSSAMPQKRNPGVLNRTRTLASNAMGFGFTAAIRSHNIPAGMSDAKGVDVNAEMVNTATSALRGLNTVLTSLVINPERALEEVNNDWAASQEVADVLMRKYKLPFRVGHHVASEIVSYAREKNIKPLDFPYSQVQRIYSEVIKNEYPQGNPKLPMSEKEFKATLDPATIIMNRATSGGPQPKEVERMLKKGKEEVAVQDKWIKEKVNKLDSSLKKLDEDFNNLIK